MGIGQMPQIDYFFTVLSPYVYLAGGRLAEIAARHGAEVRFIPVHFGNLAARMGSVAMTDASDARKVWYGQDLSRQARKLGMPINVKPAYWPTNPAPASYAIISAQAAALKGAAGDLPGFVAGLSRAVWAEDRNIGDEDVLRDIMAAHRFDPSIADRGMFMAAETYSDNLEEACARGVFGVPFYMVGEQRFWGQDRLDDLDLHLAGSL
jgi:2-hydroxychromene-2-carboxylate isomerase